MRALADDFAFIQHYDLLGVHDGGNALRDDEHGTDAGGDESVGEAGEREPAR